MDASRCERAQVLPEALVPSIGHMLKAALDNSGSTTVVQF
jgi:hypothetical protein